MFRDDTFICAGILPVSYTAGILRDARCIAASFRRAVLLLCYPRGHAILRTATVADAAIASCRTLRCPIALRCPSRRSTGNDAASFFFSPRPDAFDQPSAGRARRHVRLEYGGQRHPCASFRHFDDVEDDQRAGVDVGLDKVEWHASPTHARLEECVLCPQISQPPRFCRNDADLRSIR